MSRLLFCLCMALLAGCGASRPQVVSLDWNVMGTVARVSAKSTSPADARTACSDALKPVKAVYERVEDSLSAWRADSELKRLEALSERAILARCDPAMRPCYEAAFRLMHASGGAFNPRWRGPHTLDLGAIAKGFAVDLAAAELSRRHASDAKASAASPTVPEKAPGVPLLLDLGGNLKAVSGAWRTGIRDPFREGEVSETLMLSNGMACATSAEYERGKHIYDGRTGRPVTNGVIAVTVTHPTSAMLADGLSTTLFVLGKEAGERFRARHYPEARAYWTLESASDPPGAEPSR